MIEWPSRHHVNQVINEISPITWHWDHELQVLVYWEGDNIISVPKMHSFIPTLEKIRQIQIEVILKIIGQYSP